ncbi:MAG TPA: beta-galactosidase trimerization domain-containing protein, partial [Polyangia bacterium]
DFPFSWQDRDAIRRTLLQAYVLACQAGLDPAVISEGDDLSPYSLLLCPSTQKLTTPTWLALEAAARAGATIYWSYFGGDHNFHQGPWCPNFAALTGCRHRLRYGCFDLPPETVNLSGALSLSLPTRLATTPAPYPLSRVPIEVIDPAATKSLARSDEGHLALVSHALGSGRVIFCSYPIERYLANLPDGSSRGGHQLYALLGEAAGLSPRYPSPHPDVQVRVLEDGADDLIVAQHRGWAEEIAPLDLGAPIFARGLTSSGALGPKAVTLHRVRAR